MKEQLKDARQNNAYSGGIIGNAPALRQVLDVARQAAPSTATVLLMGESGTGKGCSPGPFTVSPRTANPFIAVNCGALPDGIIEAELFGAKGAFTGANTTRDGRFARAHGRTLFLDPVGELAHRAGQTVACSAIG